MESFAFLPSAMQQIYTSLSNILYLNFPQLSQSNFGLRQANLHFPNQVIVYTRLPSIKTDFSGFFNSLSYLQFTIFGVTLCWIVLSLFQESYPRVPHAPYHGYRVWFEPKFLLQARTFFYCRSIIKSGFEKVYNTSLSKALLGQQMISTKTHRLLFGSPPRT